MNRLLFFGIRLFAVLVIILISCDGLVGQVASVTSPNNKITVSLVGQDARKSGSWHLRVTYSNDGNITEVIPQINLGLSRSDQLFHDELSFKRAGRPLLIKEEYKAITGKRSHCTNTANEVTVSFENPSKAKMNLIIRAYNDGVAFRYEFPAKIGTYKMLDEFTAYNVSDSTKRWLQRFHTANENLYKTLPDGNERSDWGYPALFQTPDQSCCYLLHEADIVESTLVDDVSIPSILKDESWVIPGNVSWNYWSDNNGPEFTTTALEHNTILPFTRNVVGSMGYTPVTFTNSQYPRITSYGHELALSVVFESGLQHLADRPEGYYALSDAPKQFLRDVPSSWDETKFIDGYPGRDIVLARRKGEAWFIGAISGENKFKTQTVNSDFLPDNTKYSLTLISDGNYDTVFEVKTWWWINQVQSM